MNLAGQNLNTLVALEALLTERSVGRAARRMGITQSAMSHTLRQLRETLGDALLVRVGNSMVPTPYAEEVMPRLRHGLGELDAILSGRAVFEPATLEHAFTVATHDGVAGAVLSPLFARLHASAPRAQLRLVTVNEATLQDELARGGCDVAIIPPFLPLSGVKSRATAPSGVAVVHRRGHPAFARGVTLDAYCECPHLVMSLSGASEGPSFVDHLLAKLNRKRRTVVRVPYLFVAPPLIESSDLIATVPTATLPHFCEHFAIDAAQPPFELPGGSLMVTWHERFDADPAHRFFRELILEVFDTVSDGGFPMPDSLDGSSG